MIILFSFCFVCFSIFISLAYRFVDGNLNLLIAKAKRKCRSVLFFFLTCYEEQSSFCNLVGNGTFFLSMFYFSRVTMDILVAIQNFDESNRMKWTWVRNRYLHEINLTSSLQEASMLTSITVNKRRLSIRFYLFIFPIQYNFHSLVILYWALSFTLIMWE